MIGNRRAGDQLDGLVLQDLVLAARDFHVAELGAKIGDLLRIRAVNSHELAAAPLYGRGHAVDVRVVEADHAEANGMFARRRFGLRFLRRGRAFAPTLSMTAVEAMPASPADCRKARRSVCSCIRS